MTRKRFVKLLMSYGIQRNEAQAAAFLYNVQKKPYAEAYRDSVLKISFKKASIRLAAVFGNMTKEISKLCNAIAALNLNLQENYKLQPLYCKDCPNLVWFGDYNLHYCDITKEVVEPEWECD